MFQIEACRKAPSSQKKGQWMQRSFHIALCFEHRVCLSVHTAQTDGMRLNSLIENSTLCITPYYRIYNWEFNPLREVNQRVNVRLSEEKQRCTVGTYQCFMLFRSVAKGRKSFWKCEGAISYSLILGIHIHSQHVATTTPTCIIYVVFFIRWLLASETNLQRWPAKFGGWFRPNADGGIFHSSGVLTKEVPITVIYSSLSESWAAAGVRWKGRALERWVVIL